LAVFQGKHKYW